jgi:predicted dehydrogenase
MFATLENSADPVRVVLVGAGQMGRNWLRVLTASNAVELVGLVDLDVDLATKAAADAGLDAIAIGPDLGTVIRNSDAQAVINVTVPLAHHSINTQALFSGLPVLCEKPIAPTVSQALSLVAAADASGQLLMTSQSRRYYATLAAFRREVRSLGGVGSLSTEFFKAPHFPGFREQMAHPLLIDMAIHPFDVARYLLDVRPLWVYCESYNPPWSWYAGDAAATAIFEFEGGIRYSYTGSWVSGGLETSWNGAWRASGPAGSATWDGETAPNVEYMDPDLSSGRDAAEHVDEPTPTEEEIGGALAEFVDAIRTGRTPSGDVHSNVLSLAMVEAAVRSADTGLRVSIDQIIEDAYREAAAAEKNPEVRAVLESWGSSAGLFA